MAQSTILAACRSSLASRGAQLGASPIELPDHHDFVGDNDRLQFDRGYVISLR